MDSHLSNTPQRKPSSVPAPSTKLRSNSSNRLSDKRRVRSQSQPARSAQQPRSCLQPISATNRRTVCLFFTTLRLKQIISLRCSALVFFAPLHTPPAPLRSVRRTVNRCPSAGVVIRGRTLTRLILLPSFPNSAVCRTHTTLAGQRRRVQVVAIFVRLLLLHRPVPVGRRHHVAVARGAAASGAAAAGHREV